MVLTSLLSAGRPVLTGEGQSGEDQTKDQGLAERLAGGDHPEAGQHGVRVSNRQFLLAGGKL